MRWLFALLAVLTSVLATAQYTVQVIPNVVYTSASGYPQLMDVYLPLPRTLLSRPGIVCVHGGGWSGGSKEDFAGWANYYASRGYVCATINYRLAPQHHWPAQIDDTQAAVRFMRKNASLYGIDSLRIGACGVSAGGHLVQFLGTTDTLNNFDPALSGFSSRVAVVVDYVGPCDLTRQSDFVPDIWALVVQMVGVPYSGGIGAYQAASPVNYVSPGDAYSILFYGGADPIVPISQGYELDQAMTANGVPHRFFNFPNQGHGFDDQTFAYCVQIQNKALDSHLMLRMPHMP